jgi:DNA-binding beta-propeller fold protein YncE
MNALGVALSPDGRYAIVSNDDERQGKEASLLDPLTLGGYSLAVVDTQSMTVVDRYRRADESFFVGVVALPDPASSANVLVLASGGPSNLVYALDLDGAGHLTPDARHTIAMPAPSDAAFANSGHAFPSSIVASPDGTRAYVVDNLSNNVAQIDVRARSVAGSAVPVGFFPLGAALGPSGLIVANEGMLAYGVLPAPTLAPRFAAPPADDVHASSLSLISVNGDGSLAASPGAGVMLDRQPDGLREVGGAHPAAVAAMHSRPYAFVAMSNVDRIATIALGAGTPRAVGGTELRLYNRGPYGTQPDALALDRTETRLYVALAGINAVAVLDVRDPLHPHRLGLIATGWYPAALALSSDGRYLFVANAKGIGHDRGFEGDQPTARDARGHVLGVSGDSNAIWATLERIDLRTTNVRRSTPLALSYLRKLRGPAPSAIVPQRFEAAHASPLKHVVFVLEENKTFDSMLGDLTDAAGNPHGPGDPELIAFDKTVTPNLHQLAAEFALAGNLYADSEESDAGHQFAGAGIASVFTEKTLLVKSGRRPLVNKNEDPEDYPRAGYIFNSLALHGRTFRDYGDFVRVSGYDEGQAREAATDDPNFVSVDDQAAPTRGLGGLFTLDVPAPAVLNDRVDLNYPGWNLRIRDVRRAAEFMRDYDPLVKAGRMPEFTWIWLPADHGGAGADIPPLPEEVADGDRALGTIVDYLTHLPEWSSTAIFIMPDDAQSTRDHVNVHRSYAVVVSPYARRGFVGTRHLSTVSVLKTEEEILGLPALSLGDALATDMHEFFTSKRDLAPYTHVDVPPQTASVEGGRIAALLARTDQSAPDADSRAPEIVDLARRADALARRRALVAPPEYAHLQSALYERALALVN